MVVSLAPKVCIKAEWTAEGVTPITTGVTSTTYTDIGVVNGIEYYFKMGAMSSAGTFCRVQRRGRDPTTAGPVTEGPYDGTAAANLSRV